MRISIGYASGNSGQLNNTHYSNWVGSGYMNQGTNSVAVGLYAGFTGQGENCLAIVNQAGLTSQPNDSIVINAGNLALSGTTQISCYIQPIRNFITGGSTSNIVCYDNLKKELIHADNIRFANPVSFPLGTLTQTSVKFGALNTGMWSSSSNSINWSTTGVQRLVYPSNIKQVVKVLHLYIFQLIQHREFTDQQLIVLVFQLMEH